MQLAQRIDTVENTLNKKFDNLQYSITNINKFSRGTREREVSIPNTSKS